MDVVHPPAGEIVELEGVVGKARVSWTGEVADGTGQSGDDDL